MTYHLFPTPLVTGRRKKLMLCDIRKAVKFLCINVVHCTPSILAVVPLDDYPILKTVSLLVKFSGRIQSKIGQNGSNL